MNPSIQAKLEHLVERQEEINGLLMDPATINDQNSFRSLSIELSDIEPVVRQYRALQSTRDELESASTLLSEGDSEMKALIQEEIKSLESVLTDQEQEIQRLLIPISANFKFSIISNKNFFIKVTKNIGFLQCDGVEIDRLSKGDVFTVNRSKKVVKVIKLKNMEGFSKKLARLLKF